MATAYRVLGQAAPAATTLYDIYTVPASSQIVVSTVSVCNRGATDATFRLAVRPNGAAASDEHYVFYDNSVYGKSTIAATIGITADAADVLSVYSSTGNISFSVFGSLIV